MAGIALVQIERDGVRVNLAELVQSRRDGRSYARLSRDGGGAPKEARWAQLGTDGGMGTNAVDPDTVQSVARALYVTERTVWLAVGESLGLETWDAADELMSQLPVSILRKLRRRHWEVLVPYIRALAEDADREDTIAELQARIAELEAPKRPAPRRAPK